jgi:phosphoglycerate dehydrogenase-like enzyme
VAAPIEYFSFFNFCWFPGWKENLMRILFAAPENAWGGFLNAMRAELPEHCFEATGSFAIDSLKGFDVLIPTMTPVTKEMLQESDRLKLIQQCGAGVEGIDIEAAREQDIWVANVPTIASGGADSAAELGIFLMIGVSRNYRQMSRSLSEQKMGEPIGRALSRSTAGIVGLGGIGRALVKRLRGFDVRIMGIKRRNQRQSMEELQLDWVGRPEDLKQLLGMSDYVFLSLPLTSSTMNLMDHDSFSAMKRGSFLINLSRGGLVSREALAKALETGRIAGAGLDVFWQEPPDPDDPIFRYNVMATPHVATYTDMAMQGVVKAAAENIRRVNENQIPHYRVTF